MRADEFSKNILMISALPLWSMGEGKGAATFFKTIEGYVERGARISLLLGSKHVEGLPNEVKVYSIDAMWLKSLIKVPHLSILAQGLWTIIFSCWATLLGLYLMIEEDFDCVYGYEITGVPTAWLLGRVNRTVSIARFQGTILYPYLKSFRHKILYWDHFLAMTLPVDLIIMANDGTEGDKVLEHLKVPASRIKFWMNGISIGNGVGAALAVDSRILAHKKSGGQVIICVSRLVGWKRLDRILAAMPAILSMGSDVMLVIVGDGAARSEYEKLAVIMKVEHRVVFVGAIPQEAIPDYLDQADLFVSFYDLSNLGNPLLEAMRLGKCIITLDNGATGSVIKSGINGVLIKPDCLYKIPTEVHRLLNNPEERIRLGKSAKEFSNVHFRTWPERMDLECEVLAEKICTKRIT